MTRLFVCCVLQALSQQHLLASIVSSIVSSVVSSIVPSCSAVQGAPPRPRRRQRRARVLRRGAQLASWPVAPRAPHPSPLAAHASPCRRRPERTKPLWSPCRLGDRRLCGARPAQRELRHSLRCRREGAARGACRTNDAETAPQSKRPAELTSQNRLLSFGTATGLVLCHHPLPPY